MATLDDAIRIAHRWANREGSPSNSEMLVVMQALSGMPHPDQPTPLKGDLWRWESDGDGPPTKRRDQYIVPADGLGRIATFEGPEAWRNARVASCAPLMFNALSWSEAMVDKLARDAVGTDPGEPTVYDEPLRVMRHAVGEVLNRRSR